MTIVPGGGTKQHVRFCGQVRAYRHLQLLMEEFSGLFAGFLLINHALVIVLVVLSVNGSVQADGTMAAGQILFAAWLLACYLKVVDTYAGVNNGSKALLVTSLACTKSSDRGLAVAYREQTTMILKRELRSLRELRIKGGRSTFYFDKQLVLTVIGIVLNESVNLILLQ